MSTKKGHGEWGQGKTVYVMMTRKQREKKGVREGDSSFPVPPETHFPTASQPQSLVTQSPSKIPVSECMRLWGDIPDPNHSAHQHNDCLSLILTILLSIELMAVEVCISLMANDAEDLPMYICQPYEYLLRRNVY